MSRFDGSDILIFFGMILMGYGLYLIWQPLTPLIIGLIIFGLGVFGAWKKGPIK
jgi:hypothetical protein